MTVGILSRGTARVWFCQLTPAIVATAETRAAGGLARTCNGWRAILVRVGDGRDGGSVAEGPDKARVIREAARALDILAADYTNVSGAAWSADITTAARACMD